MLTAEIVSPEIYNAHAVAVDDLQAQAVQPNIFAEPALVNAAAELGAGKIHVILIWREAGNSRELVGAWPLKMRGSILNARLHEYMMLTVPLVHQTYAGEIWQALLAAAESLSATAVHCPFMPENMYFELQAILKVRAQKSVILAREERAFLTAGDNSGGSLAESLTAKTRRNMKQQRRGMEKIGALSYISFFGEEARAKLANFLALESSGWKGQRGTAIANRVRDKNFIAASLRHLANEKFFISALMCGGAPLAMGLVFQTHGTMWFLKVAYDETAARFSPGIHYIWTLADEMLATPEFRETDSCAPVGLGRQVGPFKTSRGFVNVLVAGQGSHSIKFLLLALMMKNKLQFRQAAKRTVKLLFKN